MKKLSKKNLEKLKKRIVDSGFCAPFFIWDDGSGSLRIIDGHQRRTALVALEADGYSIPPLPVDYIHAETEEEAREILLSVSSQYGEWVEDELESWFSEINESLKETLRFTNRPLFIKDAENSSGDYESDEIEYKSKFQLIIDFEDEQSIQRVYDEMNERGYSCKVSTL